ncbi:transcription initiation factor TFIID subunit 9 [Ostrinia nubilalis]|uniref:transcription initiation factor TFIID subunit 9 n=1 Tax=Ostrinia furnacalis TaxID=93504 RepID=UPI00103BC987|nr:transcription initiation factor TFIID subunit 9 [Ostrinia furnacalis]
MGDKDKSKLNAQNKHIPKDAQVIMSIMKEVGITDYEPRVVNQLLEFTYRYVTSILDDARVFANHAKKKTIDLEDVRLAVQMQLDKSFTSPPPREVLLEVARTKNVNPLPLIKPHCGLRLPPDRYCLSACNYRLKPAKKAPVKATVATAPAIKTITTAKSNLGQQNVVMKRPSGGIVNVSASKPNVVPKPVLKFTSSSKVVAKPAVRVTAGPSAQGPVKMEVDDQTGAQKRKREDDDYDM